MNNQSHDILNSENNRDKYIWYVGVILVVAYMLVCIAVNELFFSHQETPGLIKLSSFIMRGILYCFIAATIIIQCVILFLKRNYRHPTQESVIEIGEVEKKRIIRGLVLASLCDTVALFGLAGFLLQGDLKIMFIFGLISLFLYAQVYPEEKRTPYDHNI